MLHIPILRHGQPYESVDKVEIVHHATGEPVARVSQANSGLIARDVHRMDHDVLEQFTVKQLLAMCKKAGELFMKGTLPIGDEKQSFDDYVTQLSSTTGMPISYCRTNAGKIFNTFDNLEVNIAGLTRGFPLEVLDNGYGNDDGRMLSWYREARTFGAILPSNSPGVHSLWIPAIALKTPIVLKPGRDEPWSPLRIIAALMAAGVPKEAFGFYPTDHGGSSTILQVTDRSMLFGDAGTTKAWAKDPRVELHGPGWSKVILGDDAAEEWPKYVDLIASSIAANGGRSCINASAVWTPKYSEEIAEAVAKKLSTIQALPADHPDAQIAAFSNPKAAEGMNNAIESQLAGARDVTQEIRGTPRLVREGRLAWLLPTVVHCDREHALAGKEYLFPYAAVVECPTAEIPEAIGPTLVATTLTNDPKFKKAIMACEHISRLNIGPIPTWRLSWDQPLEGNLFEHLYRQRAFQMAETAT